MGKIRVKVLGDKDAEKKQKDNAKKRADAKRVSTEITESNEKNTKTPGDSGKGKISDTANSPVTPVIAKKTVKKDTVAGKKVKHSEKYRKVLHLVDKNRAYPLTEALLLLPQIKLAGFDESVELHINTSETGISGNFILPHGTGKKMRIIIVNQSEDPKSVEELVKKVEAGHIDFDVLIATPDSMPKLARVARYLGPRGLMPNPKNGTVTPKPQEVAKKYESGQINFKTESKFPILHLTVGKISFGENKLAENIKTAVEAVQLKNIKSITLKTTMSPAIKLSLEI